MDGFNQSEFLDLVYGAALDPMLWTPVMARYADAISGEKGWLALLNLADGRGGGVLSRIDPLEMDRYMAHFAEINPLNRVKDTASYVRSWAPRILTDEDWMPKSELMVSEYYNDFLKPQDIHSCLMVRLACRGGRTATINITRPEQRGQFEGEDLAFAHSLHPHLIRAFELSQKLALDRTTARGFSTVFDESTHGLFLLDGAGRVQHMNPTAEALVARRRGVSISSGALSALDPAQARALQGLIGRAAARDAPARTGGSMALTPPEGGTPLSVSVAPVRMPELMLLGGAPSVIVCVTDLDAAIRLPERRLREVFGLTPAETRLALTLFEGESLAEAAETLKISRFTAQNHLARIFEKTGTNRQAVLIKLMMRAVGPILGELDLEPRGTA